MKTSIMMLVALALPVAALAAGTSADWAFLMPDANQPAEAARPGTYTLPGSPKRYAQPEIDNLKAPPDWYPDSHPPAPKAVTSGGAEKMAFACGSCHLMSGMGHPESSSLAGQPLAYLVRQMADFKSGARAHPMVVDGKPVVDSVQFMVLIAKSWPDADLVPALQYFSALKPMPWVKVVETKTVPKSYVTRGYMRVPAPGGGKEPLGQRIVELPQDLERQILRDPNSGSVAYVPKGAVARGKALAAKGPMPCAACHGADLKGQGDIPGLAGRSPIYNARQLYMFKDGSRNGPMAAQMKDSVAPLGDKDIVDLSAYLASLAP